MAPIAKSETPPRFQGAGRKVAREASNQNQIKVKPKAKPKSSQIQIKIKPKSRQSIMKS